MIVTLTLDGRDLRADLTAGTSIGIAVGEDGRHPRFFVGEGAQFRPLRAGDFSGRVHAGGSCNADIVEFVPHCHGTHTESYGHVTANQDPVDQTVNGSLFTARLVSITPDRIDDQGSPILSSTALAGQLDRQALIIRTLPNEQSKRWRDYSQAPNYPILSDDAMRAVAKAGIRHLLIDTPSLDAATDPTLRLHRLYWQMAPGQVETPAERSHATVTEMIFVPDSLADGDYLIHLGLSTLVRDATPSSPTLFALR